MIWNNKKPRFICHARFKRLPTKTGAFCGLRPFCKGDVFRHEKWPCKPAGKSPSVLQRSRKNPLEKGSRRQVMGRCGEAGLALCEVVPAGSASSMLMRRSLRRDHAQSVTAAWESMTHLREK